MPFFPKAKSTRFMNHPCDQFTLRSTCSVTINRYSYAGHTKVLNEDELEVSQWRRYKTLYLMTIAAVCIEVESFVLLAKHSFYIWVQNYDPAGQWGVLALLAAIPLILLLTLMPGFRMKAYRADLIAMASALVVTIGLFRVPVKLSTWRLCMTLQMDSFRSSGSSSPLSSCTSSLCAREIFRFCSSASRAAPRMRACSFS
jgi:hypothetical protein